MKIIDDYRRAKANGATMRPVWQIAAILPLWLIYVPAKAFVSWMDRNI